MALLTLLVILAGCKRAHIIVQGASNVCPPLDVYLFITSRDVIYIHLNQTPPIIIYFKDAKMFRCNYYTNINMSSNNKYIRLKNMYNKCKNMGWK
jgi:hypothetical protein